MNRADYILNKSTYVDPISDHKQNRLLQGDYQFAHVGERGGGGGHVPRTNYRTPTPVTYGRIPEVHAPAVSWPKSNTGARRSYDGQGTLWEWHNLKAGADAAHKLITASRTIARNYMDSRDSDPGPTAPPPREDAGDDGPFTPTVPQLPAAARGASLALRAGRQPTSGALPSGPRVTPMSRRSPSTIERGDYEKDIHDAPGVRRAHMEIMDAVNPTRKFNRIVDTTARELENNPAVNVRNSRLTDADVDRIVPQRRRSIIPQGPDPRQPASKRGLGDYGRNRFHGLVEGL